MARRDRTLATRHKILQAALGEFAHSGFDGASMLGVSRAAGVANGTVYWHFATKSGLYLAVVQHASAEFHAGVARFADEAAASFADVVDRVIEYLQDNPEIDTVLSSLRSAQPRADAHEAKLMRDAARMVDGGLVDVWRRWIRIRRSPDTTSTFNSENLARLIASTVSGLLTARFIDPQMDVREALTDFETLLGAALAERPDVTTTGRHHG